jgi:hypothetical protein
MNPYTRSDRDTWGRDAIRDETMALFARRLERPFAQSA